MSLPYVGELAGLATAACWMVSALAFESAGKRVGSLSLNVVRLVLGLVLLTVFAAFTRPMALPMDATPHAWGWLTVSGLIGFVLGDYCLFRAFVEIGPRLSSLLMTSTPIWAALIGLLVLGETMAARELGAMSLVVAGIAWAVSDRHPADDSPRPAARGIGFALLGSLGQAGGLVLSKLGMGDYDPFAATQIRVFAGIIGFAVVCSAAGWWPRVLAALRDAQAMRATMVGAVFGPFLGVSLSLISVQRAVNAGVAATLMSVTPILLVPAVMIRGEKVGWPGILGTVLAVVGSALFFI